MMRIVFVKIRSLIIIRTNGVPAIFSHHESIYFCLNVSVFGLLAENDSTNYDNVTVYDNIWIAFCPFNISDNHIYFQYSMRRRNFIKTKSFIFIYL